MRRLVTAACAALLVTGCQSDTLISLRRPSPPDGVVGPRSASIALADFTDARPPGERDLVGRSAEPNLAGKYSRVVHTSDDVARVTTQAVRDDLERNGFAVLPSDRVVVSGSVTRAWIELRRGWGFGCTAVVAADVDVRGAGGMVHTYVVGKSEWSDALESPKANDLEEVFQEALQDLAGKVSAFVRQNVRPEPTGAAASP